MKNKFSLLAGPIVLLCAAVIFIFMFRRVESPENGRLSNPSWAGTYYQGDGLGANRTLSITAEGQFTYEWRGCLGVYGKDNGVVADIGGRLRLRGRLTAQMDYHPQEYLMVRWGKRRYLIPPEEILEFCAGVRGGCEPRDDPHGSFYLQLGDEKIEPESDEPQLPNGYEKYLRMEDIDVRIKSLSQRTVQPVESNNRDQTIELRYAVTLDAGNSEGVLPKMTFHRLVEPGDCRIVITETSDHESQGFLTDRLSRNETIAEPKVGDRFRAPAPWPCAATKSRIFPLSGRVTVDGVPSQGDGRICVMLYRPKTAYRLSEQRYAWCEPNGEFSFSSYKKGDGVGVGTYVVLIAELKRQGKIGFAGPDRLNNLYNDPDVNAQRPDFVIEHKKPGKTDYVFDLKIRGVKPVKQPGPKALTELKR